MASTSSAQPTKKGALKNKFFTAKSPGVAYLVEQFRKHSEDPSTGINFRVRQNDEIRKIFVAHPIFADYSSRAFVDQFKKYANNFQLEQTRRRDTAIHSTSQEAAAATKP